MLAAKTLATTVCKCRLRVLVEKGLASRGRGGHVKWKSRIASGPWVKLPRTLPYGNEHVPNSFSEEGGGPAFADKTSAVREPPHYLKPLGV